MYKAPAAEALCKRIAIVPNLVVSESTLIPPTSGLFTSHTATPRIS